MSTASAKRLDLAVMASAFNVLWLQVWEFVSPKFENKVAYQPPLSNFSEVGSFVHWTTASAIDSVALIVSENLVFWIL